VFFYCRLANQDKDASYSATIAVGSTSQTFEVALDTGSADLVSLALSFRPSPKDGRRSLRTSHENPILVVVEYRMFPSYL
jgi:hypothetical protein